MFVINAICISGIYYILQNFTNLCNTHMHHEASSPHPTPSFCSNSLQRLWFFPFSLICRLIRSIAHYSTTVSWAHC